jgi:hypothetical protein
MEDKSKQYLNPYLAGVALGLVLLVTFYIGGNGLGASGAIKRGAIAIVNVVSETPAEGGFFAQYGLSLHSVLNNWIVYMFIGVFLGGFLSGLVQKRVKLTVDHGPRISWKIRLVMALIGGSLFGIGAQLGKGCTSGAALSGMATLSSAGFIVMMGIFGTAFMLAYFFRRFWL